jgi:ribosomal protein L33
LKLHSCLADLQKNGKNLKKTKKMVLTKTIEYGIINKLVYSGNTNILLGGIETMRVQVILECTETKLRHYVTTKNKKTHPERLEMRKYNPVLKRHSLYREVK